MEDTNRLSRVEISKKPTIWTGAIAILAIIAFSEPQASTMVVYRWAKVIGYMLVTSAMLGRIWCAIYIDGYKNNQLIQDGPYSICRNPLYIFSFFGVAGVLMGAQSLSLLVIVIPIYWAYFSFVTKSEEERLSELFGQESIHYSSEINRFLPSFRTYWSRDTIEVRPRLVLRSIIRSSFFMWSLLLVDIFEYMKVIEINGRVIIPTLWNLPF